MSLLELHHENGIRECHHLKYTKELIDVPSLKLEIRTFEQSVLGLHPLPRPACRKPMGT